jgi:hypothetical protein
MERKGLLLLWLFSLALLASVQGASAKTPSRADCERACAASNEAMKDFTVAGNNAHCVCECRPGWSRPRPGTACVREEASRHACISDAGYQLIFALRDCKAEQPSLFQCLKGTGVSTKTLDCLAALPAVAGSVKSCGILVASVPLDAAIRCRDVANSCIARALADHKVRIAACSR